MPKLRELMAQLLYLEGNGSKSGELKKQIGRELQHRRVAKLICVKEFAGVAILTPEQVEAVEKGEAGIADIMIYHRSLRG